MFYFSKHSICRRPQHAAHRWGRMVVPSTIALLSLSSCLKDDMSDCPAEKQSKVSLTFDYTYNVKEADAFSSEVKNINVYAFDENGKFFDSYIESADKFETGHTMDISGLKDGKYTFVCLARDRQLGTRADDDEQEFSFSSLTPGVSTIDDLTEKMGKIGEDEPVENNKKFAALYTAQTSVDFKNLNTEGKTGNVVVSKLSLMKCTKTYRIVLMPFNNEQTDFTPENFDVRIEGSAAWLDHKGDKVQNERITYLPHYSAKKDNYGDDMTSVDEQPIDQALVYDLSSSRMFETHNDSDDSKDNESGASTKIAEKTTYSDKRIIITDLRGPEPKEVFNHSLPWFLAMCGENMNEEWSDQEYLDRQDHYVLVFYIPDTRDYNMIANVKVNGWTVNLKDIGIGGSETSGKADNK